MKYNLADYLENKLNLTPTTKSIALFPGKFKPPHLGHLYAVEQTLKKVDKVIIIISDRAVSEPDGRRWTPEESKKIWKNLIKDSKKINNEASVKILISPIDNKTPIATAYKILEKSINLKNKDVFFIKSSKDDAAGDKRFELAAIEKALSKNTNAINTKAKELSIKPLGGLKKPMSSSDIRNLPSEERKKINPLYEAINKHTTHLEDLLFEKGYRGYYEAIRNVLGALDILSGKGSKLSLSEKIDGRVAIFFGTDPDDGKLFVGNKSSFSKAGKKAKTPAEVDEMYGGKGDLPQTLKKVLSKLAPQAKGEIYQGDLLWGSSGDLKKSGGSTSFTPNTITYTLPITNLPDLGIAVHTKYEGKSWESMVGSNNFTVDKLRKSGYFILDPKIKKPKATNIDIPKVKAELNAILKGAQKFKAVQELTSDEVVQEILPIWINSKVREGTQEIGENDWDKFEQFVSDRYDKKISDLKSEKGKDKWIAAKKSILSKIASNKNNAVIFINSYNKFIELKNKILNELKGKEQLVGSINGKPSGEGWMLLSKGGKFVKLVDRAEFSKANFEISKNRKGK